MNVDRHPMWKLQGIDLIRNDEFFGMVGDVITRERARFM